MTCANLPHYWIEAADYNAVRRHIGLIKPWQTTHWQPKAGLWSLRLAEHEVESCRAAGLRVYPFNLPQKELGAGEESRLLRQARLERLQ